MLLCTGDPCGPQGTPVNFFFADADIFPHCELNVMFHKKGHIFLYFITFTTVVLINLRAHFVLGCDI